jgi:capsular polysaccharide biosynthesis protein
MRPPPDAPRAHDYLRLLMDSWIVIVLAFGLSAGAGWLVWHNEHKCVATVRLLIVEPGGAEPSDAFFGNLTALSRALTYQQLARSTQVTMRTIDLLKLHQSPADLAKNVTMVPTQTAVLEMRVAAADPGVAQNTANAEALSLIEVSKEIETVDTAATDLVMVDVANGAGDNRGSLATTMLFAGLLGLAASVVLVFGYGLAVGSVIDRRQVGDIVARTTAGEGTR